MAVSVVLGAVFQAPAARAGTWDLDGYYAAQTRQTEADSQWGGTMYLRPRYFFDGSGGGFGAGGQLTITNGLDLFAGGAYRTHAPVFFEVDVGATAGGFGPGAAVTLQVGYLTSSKIEISYVLLFGTSASATILPYIGMRL